MWVWFKLKRPEGGHTKKYITACFENFSMHSPNAAKHTRKDKYGNFPSETSWRPKSAIYTPKRETRASPSLSRGDTPPPGLLRLLWSRSNANNMRKNRNPASSSKFSRFTRIPVLYLGHMTVCLENSENFSLRLLQAFTSGARMFGLAQRPCWILKMSPPYFFFTDKNQRCMAAPGNTTYGPEPLRDLNERFRPCN